MCFLYSVFVIATTENHTQLQSNVFSTLSRVFYSNVKILYRMIAMKSLLLLTAVVGHYCKFSYLLDEAHLWDSFLWLKCPDSMAISCVTTPSLLPGHSSCGWNVFTYHLTGVLLFNVSFLFQVNMLCKTYPGVTPSIPPCWLLFCAFCLQSKCPPSILSSSHFQQEVDSWCPPKGE